MIRKLSTAMAGGLISAALWASVPAFAATDPGAAACQPAAGQLTAAIAQTGALGSLIASIAPINQLNQQSLFHC